MTFKPETLAILAERPYLADLMQEGANPPVVKNREPDQIELYMGDSTRPTFLFQKGKPIEYVDPETAPGDPYILVTVADDNFISMVIGDDVIFDYSDLVDLPDIDLSDRQQQLSDIEAQIAKLNQQIEEVV